MLKSQFQLFLFIDSISCHEFFEVNQDNLLQLRTLFSINWLKSITSKIEFDGLTMMFLIFQKTQPSTIVGLNSFLKKLKTCKTGDHSNDINKMLTFMESNYEVLCKHNKAPEHYRLLLNALCTGPNNSFNLYVDRIKDDIDSGLGLHSQIEPDTIIIACRQKYTNTVELKEWFKVDPRNAQLMTLVTQLQALQEKQSAAVLATAAGPTTNKRQGFTSLPKGDVVEGTSVEKWRIIKDSKTKVVNGATWHWCPYHVLEGIWDGMYLRHAATACPAIAAKNAKKNGGQTIAAAAAPTAGTAATAAAASKATLDIQAKLKEVLCTNLCLSDEVVNKIFDQASAEN